MHADYALLFSVHMNAGGLSVLGRGRGGPSTPKHGASPGQHSLGSGRGGISPGSGAGAVSPTGAGRGRGVARTGASPDQGGRGRGSPARGGSRHGTGAGPGVGSGAAGKSSSPDSSPYVVDLPPYQPSPVPVRVSGDGLPPARFGYVRDGSGRIRPMTIADSIKIAKAEGRTGPKCGSIVAPAGDDSSDGEDQQGRGGEDQQGIEGGNQPGSADRPYPSVGTSGVRHLPLVRHRLLCKALHTNNQYLAPCMQDLFGRTPTEEENPSQILAQQQLVDDDDDDDSEGDDQASLVCVHSIRRQNIHHMCLCQHIARINTCWTQYSVYVSAAPVSNKIAGGRRGWPGWRQRWWRRGVR